MSSSDTQSAWTTPTGNLFVFRLVTIIVGSVFALILAAILSWPSSLMKWFVILIVSYVLVTALTLLYCSALEMILYSDRLAVRTRFRSYSLDLNAIRKLYFLRWGANVLGGELWMTMTPSRSNLLPIRMIHVQYLSPPEKQRAVDFVETLRSAVEPRRRGQEV